MSTQYYNTALDHTTDLGFRAWGQEFSDALQNVGLVKHTDTGQINWLTSTRPAINVAAGYEIRKFDSTVGSTIYIKFEYGTSGSSTGAQIWITCGTGTDGAGNITGIHYTRTSLMTSAAFNNTSLYPTWVCKVDGCFWFQFKAGWTQDTTIPVKTHTGGFFSITRSCDDTGAITNDTLFFHHGATTSSTTVPVSVVNVGTNAVTHSTTTSDYCFIPGTVTSSLVGLDLQVYLWYYPAPRVRPVFSTVSVIRDEANIGDTFVTAPIGSTNRTYLSLGRYRQGASVNGNSTLCMIWQ